MKTEVRRSAPGVWSVGDQELQFPVLVQQAKMATCVYRAPRAAAVEALAGTTFEPIIVAGKALSIATFIRYIEGDLGSYDEFGVGLAVKGPGGKSGMHVFHLPVTAEFTMHAGRGIWGLPKYIVESGSSVEAKQVRLELAQGGQQIVTGSIAGSLRLPGSARMKSFGWAVGLQGDNLGKVLGMPNTVRTRNTRVGRSKSELVWGDHPMGLDAMKLGMRGRPLLSFTNDVQLRIEEPEVH